MQNEDKALSLYREYLTKLGRETEGMTEHTEWKGSWRYFYREAGRIQKADEIAVGPGGQIVSQNDKDHWHPFLSQPGLDAAQLAERVVWITSRMGQALGPTFKLKSKKAQQLVSKPLLDRSPDGTLKLTFWAIHPPAMDAPYRVTLTAPPMGSAQFESIGWEDLTPKK